MSGPERSGGAAHHGIRASVPDNVRRLCASIDIVAWSSRATPGREELQWRLHGALEEAAPLAGIDFTQLYLQPAGDGGLIVFPADVDEPRAIAALIRTLGGGLPAEGGQEPMRLRLALAEGILRERALGFSTNVAIHVSRLVGCDAIRDALAIYPAAALAVIVDGPLYHDVVAQALDHPPAEEFWAVQARAKNYSEPAWLYVSDRTGGPASAAAVLTSPVLAPPVAQLVAPPLPVFVPGWTAAPTLGPAGPADRIGAEPVEEVLSRWRSAVALPVAPDEIRIGVAELAEVLADTAALTADGRHAQAFLHVTAMLRRAPHAGIIATGLARVLLADDPVRHAGAVRELLDRRLLDETPGVEDTIEVLLLRAEAAFAAGEHADAAADFESVLAVLANRRTPPGPLALLRLGDCRERLGRPESAEAAWTELLRYTPLNPDAQLRLGYLELGRGHPMGAERHLGKGLQVIRGFPGTALSTAPRALEHALLMGCYRARRAFGDLDKARRLLDEAAELFPEDPFTAVEQALDLRERGRAAQSRAALTRALVRAAEAPSGAVAVARMRETGLIDEAVYAAFLARQGIGAESLD